MASGPEALVLRGVRKSYGPRLVLDDVDLTIRAGEVLGVVGPNGAGKTTLASIAVGLRRADAGEVRVLGASHPAPSPVRRRVGYVPQRSAVYPTCTVEENLSFFHWLTCGRRDPGAVARVAEDLLLTDLLPRRTAALSSGEKRRVDTAIAMVHRPDLLLLDEPTAGTDVATRERVIRAVERLAADGVAVWYASHNFSEIERLAAGVAILDRGHLIATGTVDEVVASHSTARLQAVFRGQAPTVAMPGAVRQGSVVEVPVPDDNGVIDAFLSSIGTARARLRSVEISRPNLEHVFTMLTGSAVADRDEEP